MSETTTNPIIGAVERPVDPDQISEPVLSVRDLRIAYGTGRAKVEAIRGVSFDLYPNQALALVGESGCGKTTLGLGLLRLLPKLGSTPGGSVTYRREQADPVDVLKLEKRALRRWRWAEAAMVFQGAMNAFNPVLNIQDQLMDTLSAHGERSSRSDRAAMVDHCGETLRSVRLEPRQVLGSYPHELSGGMRQRVLIAMSLLLDPRLIVFDEPTTALDILTQRAIVDLLAELREERQFAMIFISHDLSLAAELADRVATMYAGRIIEAGSVNDIFYEPKHPYTSGLINAVPPVVGDLPELASIPGSPPSLGSLPSGCAFAPRCDYVMEQCHQVDPPLETIEERPRGLTHASACLRWPDVKHERKVVAGG
ncbi:MAG: ABC transporter ATP-binding protein [Propionibacteriaceae bacterium]